MRQVAATTKGFPTRTVHRVVADPHLARQWEPGLRFLVRVDSEAELASVHRLMTAGLGNLAIVTRSAEVYARSGFPSVLETGEALQSGDVVAVSDKVCRVHVLLRESDSHHTVFLTNRCNSKCLMCSQPPTPQDDSWLVDEAFAVAAHIDNSPQVLGFTGGEPLLLGARLREILDAFGARHPETEFDVLTNGRLLCNAAFAKNLLEGLPYRVTWMVPLYGHADILHDCVVQSPGAFEQTIDGLLTLQSYRQPIQLRVVLIEPVLEVLPELCEFVGKNLPFVREVALMGCEPIGFALANRGLCEVDLSEWARELEGGVRWLNRAQLRPIIMNVPLCAMSRDLWPFAHQSISDWKRAFAPECDGCAVKTSCCGLFTWYEKGWRPTTIRAFDGGCCETI